MSGIKPFFVSGTSAKIRLNGKTLAFCTDLSYSVQVLTQTPKVLGMYEGSSVEPLGYTVFGTFTILRYAKGAGDAIGSRPNGVAANDAGNGVGNWGTVWGGKFGDTLARNGIGNDGRAHEALDPSKFHNGTTFDIQVFQKVDKRGGGSTANKDLEATNALFTATSILQGSTGNGSGGGSGPNIDFIGVANIRNCRITQADFKITKKSIATQTFNFVALYADEDSFVADFSGRGQQFASAFGLSNIVSGI